VEISGIGGLVGGDGQKAGLVLVRTVAVEIFVIITGNGTGAGGDKGRDIVGVGMGDIRVSGGVLVVKAAAVGNLNVGIVNLEKIEEIKTGRGIGVSGIDDYTGSGGSAAKRIIKSGLAGQLNMGVGDIEKT